jgi:hypothetical protein
VPHTHRRVRAGSPTPLVVGGRVSFLRTFRPASCSPYGRWRLDDARACFRSNAAVPFSRVRQIQDWFMPPSAAARIPLAGRRTGV